MPTPCTSSRSVHRFAVLSAVPLALVAATAPLAAQQGERYALSEDDVAIYNLAGTLRVEAATGGSVVVDVERRGEDAAQLQVETGRVDGRPTLRVVYPSDDIVYTDLGRSSRSQFRVRDDGTFGDGVRSGRRVTIRGGGSGFRAHANLRVQVPAGRRVAVYLGVGEAVVANVDGELLVDVASAGITAEGTRGVLRLDTGSGSISVRDAEGVVEIDTGSGAIEVERIRGSRLFVDTGSGSVDGSALDVDDLEVDTGSGGIRLANVRADDVRLDTGSGRVELGLVSDVRRVEIDTGSGGVTIYAPESLGAELEIDTGSGGIEVDLPLQVMQQRRQYLRGRLGDGDGSIRIDTGSGGVRIRRSTVTAATVSRSPVR